MIGYGSGVWIPGRPAALFGRTPAMIEPVEEIPGQNGHPNWKVNMFIGLGLVAIGIAMVCSVVAAVYGVIVIAIGGTWAIGASLIGAAQDRADEKRGIHHDHLAGT